MCKELLYQTDPAVLKKVCVFWGGHTAVRRDTGCNSMSVLGPLMSFGDYFNKTHPPGPWRLMASVVRPGLTEARFVLSSHKLQHGPESLQCFCSRPCLSKSFWRRVRSSVQSHSYQWLFELSAMSQRSEFVALSI